MNNLLDNDQLIGIRHYLKRESQHLQLFLKKR